MAIFALGLRNQFGEVGLLSLYFKLTEYIIRCSMLDVRVLDVRVLDVQSVNSSNYVFHTSVQVSGSITSTF